MNERNGKQRSRRKLSNVKLTRKYRKPFLGWWVLISSAQSVLMAMMLYLLFLQLKANAAYFGGSFESVTGMTHGQVIGILAALAALACGSIIWLSILTVHRIAGPYIALRRTFDAIRNGDAGCRLRFREGDNLDDLADSFNEMMDSVKEQRHDRAVAA